MVRRLLLRDIPQDLSRCSFLLPHSRAAYAEDELSDDPDGSSDVEVANQGAAASGGVQAANDKNGESGTDVGNGSSRITREAPRYEEDELSDDDDDESASL